MAESRLPEWNGSIYWGFINESKKKSLGGILVICYFCLFISRVWISWMHQEAVTFTHLWMWECMRHWQYCSLTQGMCWWDFNEAMKMSNQSGGQLRRWIRYRKKLRKWKMQEQKLWVPLWVSSPNSFSAFTLHMLLSCGTYVLIRERRNKVEIVKTNNQEARSVKTQHESQSLQVYKINQHRRTSQAITDKGKVWSI